VGVPRFAACHANPYVGLHQLFADVAADESTASEDGDEQVIAVDH
jgi:hypothetical protein